MDCYKVCRIAIGVLVVTMGVVLRSQNTGSIQYFHDDLGRLTRVVDQNGNVATYTYDAVGNITSISRSTLPANNGLAILSFTPQSGPIGQTVAIQGQGFSTSPSSDTVQFNGMATVVTAASATSLTVAVPAGATSGPISVAVSGQSVQSDTNFTVASATNSIMVAPGQVSLHAIGQTQQFTATGIYSNGSSHDLTSSATWSSSAPTVATVSNGSGTQGLVTVVGSGSTTITATSVGLNASAAVNVSVITSLTVTPSPGTITRGATAQFTATGTFDDNTTQNVTGGVTWTSSLPAIATISNAPGTQGVAAGLTTGATRICATLAGTSITGCTNANVVATLVSLSISPTGPIPLGMSQQMTATGAFDDGSNQNVSSQVTWDSSNPLAATISDKGLLTPVAVGTTSISASYGSISNSVEITVTPPAPVRVSVTPARVVLQVGNTLQLAATANISDGSTQDVTQTATWSASDPAVVTVSTSGLITAVGTGTANVTATSGSFSGSSFAIVITPKEVGLSRFGYVANSDGTVSIYSVNALTGGFRPNGFIRQSSGSSQAIALDPTNRFVYLSNRYSSGIGAYQVNATHGTLNSMPGSPFPAGSSPSAIVMDPTGRFLYVADSVDNTVSAFSIDANTGALTGIGGSPYSVGNYPSSLSIDPAGQILYVTNQNDSTISGFTVDSTSGALQEIPGSPFPARIQPLAIAADPKGRFIYVANRGQSGGSVAQRMIPRGAQDKSTSALGPFPQIQEPHFLGSSKQDAQQELLLAQTTGTVAPTWMFPPHLALVASLDISRSPFGHGIGNLESSTTQILGFPSLFPFNRLLAQIGVTGPSISVFALDANGVLTEVPGSPFPVPNAPNSIVTDPTGSYVYELDGNQIAGFSVDQTTGVLTQLSDSPYTTEFGSMALYMDSSGQFLYAQGNQDTQEFTLNPATGSLAAFGAYPNRGGVGSAVSEGTTALAYVPQYAYVVSSGKMLSGGSGGANDISAYSIDPASGSLTTVAGSPFAEGLFPEIGTSDPLGRFFMVTNDCSDLTCSATTGSVSGYNISPANGTLSLITGSPFTAGTGPKGMVVDPSGQFAYVANQQNNTISAYTVDQTLETLTPITGSPFAMPSGSSAVVALAVDPEGLLLYAADIHGNVWEFSLDASGTPQYPYRVLTGLSGTQSIAADPMGRFLLVLDSVSNDVVVLGTSRTTYYWSQVSGSPFPTGQTPVSVTVDPTGRFVYIANQGSGNISAYTLDPVAGTLTAIPGSPFVTDANPASVSVDISGKFLYVANQGDNTVSSFSIDPVSGALTPVTGSPMPTSTAPVSVTTTGKIQ